MTRWLCKINWYKEQCRITIPKGMVGRYGLKSTTHVTIDDTKEDHIKIRRFDINGSKKRSDPHA